MGCSPLQLSRASHLPIIIHDRDKEADLIHVLRGNVKDYCFIVGGIKCVFLYGGFLLFQSSPITEQRHFDIWIWGEEIGEDLLSMDVCFVTFAI